MILFLNPDVARALSDGKFIEIVRLFLYGEGIDGIVFLFSLSRSNRRISSAFSLVGLEGISVARSTEVITATGWGRQPGERCHVSDRQAEQE